LKRELQRPTIFLVLVVTLALSLVMPLPALAQPPLSGNVDSDFTGSGVLIIPDPVGDVGMPGTPPGVSGWDMGNLTLFYDEYTDTMYVGINVQTILGDADGDGNPSVTSTYLGGLHGTDVPDLGGTESAAVYFDLDQDGTWDVIAGISGITDYSGFDVRRFSGLFNPPNNFGSQLPSPHKGSISPNPDALHPDLEFTIINWSKLPDDLDLADGSPGFCVGAFLGSFEDDGIGEDTLDRYCYSVAPPVGGTAFPVDKLGLLAPWAILLGCAGIVTLFVIRKRRQA
jgi:hypothetical protein